jgi:integrase/recombinase XerD
MPVKKRAVVKRRNIEADRLFQADKLTVEQALTRVLNMYSAEGYRDRTIRDYEKHWREFFRIKPAEFIGDVTADDFRAYINVLLRKRGLSPSTVNIRMNALRSMFNRLHADGLIGDENPVATIRKLKVDEDTLHALTDDQVRRLFAQVDTGTFAGYRDYVAMLTMLKCGLRINEIDALEISDVDFDEGVIMLPGAKSKNRKNRLVPLNTKVRTEMAQLIFETREYFGEDVHHVFTSNDGQPLQHELIRKRMHKYGKDSGLNRECRPSPHSLRHTFAVNFLKNGGDIRALQLIMGHADISTTQVYLRYNDEDIKEKYARVAINDTLDV